MKKNILVGFTAACITASAFSAQACQNPSQWLTTSQRNTVNSISALTHNVFSNKQNTLSLNGGTRNDLNTALQLATDTGMKLFVDGTFHVGSQISVTLRNKVDVDANGATFHGTSGLDGDMFRFSATGASSSCSKANDNNRLKWNYGRFYMRNAPVAKVSPEATTRLGGQRASTKSTGDALSVRAHTGGANRLEQIDITNITFYGTQDSGRDYRYAGGDSGILLSGGDKANLRFNKFYGVRDAAIYSTADNDNGTLGDRFNMSDNIIEFAFDGVTSKRGADNINMNRNQIKDTVVAVSTKLGRTGLTWVATNVTADDNTIERTVRGMSFEYTDNVKLRRNTFNSFGANLRNSDPNKNSPQNRNSSTTQKITPRTLGTSKNRFGSQFEAISLNGVRGTDEIRDNDFNGNGNSKAYAIVYRGHTGRSTTGIAEQSISSSQGNTFSGVKSRQVNGQTRYVHKLSDYNP